MASHFFARLYVYFLRAADAIGLDSKYKIGLKIQYIVE